MAAATQSNDDLSPSTRRALGYALASALRRSPEPSGATVEPADLLVGVLLAHPDARGEGRVLLAQFGLTLRDILPEPYHELTAADLERHTADVSMDGPPPLSPSAEAVLEDARPSRGGTVHLRHVLGALINPAGPLGRDFAAALSARGSSPTRVWESYRQWLEQPLASGGRAGDALAEMLAREHPPRPVDVPSYAPDRPDVAVDLVGIREEVDAFAYLLASKALRPPLAVGLFGEWGSGKSFFMESVEDRVDVISQQVRQREDPAAPFWGRIRQIRFNAWQYVETKLWASLLAHIFDELKGQSIGLVEKRRQDLQAEHDRADAEAEERRNEELRLTKELTVRQTELTNAETQRIEGLNEIRQRRTQQLSDAVTRNALDAMRKAWGDQADELVGKDASELVSALGAARTELVRSRGLLGLYWTRTRIALASLVALVVPLVALLLDWLDLPPLVSLLGGLSLAVPAITTLLRSATQWSRGRLDAIETATRAIDADFTAQAEALEADVKAAREALATAQAELAAARSAQNEAAARVADLGEEMDRLTPAKVLVDFVEQRSGSDDYRRHLGLLSRVREDLEQLEKLVHNNNVDEARGAPSSASSDRPPPPNRIILYIDDLDRCPPNKVVQVLEAVHLLLAFELFVVVVSVDSRWLSFALTDELRALTTTDFQGTRPTPMDYIEKIFQLPFWVQPLEADGRRSLVHGLLEPSVRAHAEAAAEGRHGPPELTLGDREREALAALTRRGTDPRLEAHALVLRPEDLAFMDSLAPLLGDTPRRVKRFVNIVQLLLAMPPELDAGPPPNDREIVAFAAALNSGQPAVAREVFRLARSTPTARLGSALAGVTGRAPDEVDRLRAWLAEQPAWSALALGRLDVRLDVIRRLSFETPTDLIA